MLETDRGLASMRTCQPGALFGENEQNLSKWAQSPCEREKEGEEGEKKHGSLSFCSPRGYAARLPARQTKL